MSKPRIVFFGSGPVAAKSLSLLKTNFDVEAVVTKPTTEDEMKRAANGAAIYLVSNKQELSELLSERPFSSEVGILIDFGIIVTRDVIDYFPKGIINSHFSLLPEWRGADPITFAILSGQTKTGVSLMLIDEGMDTGQIIRQKSLPISADETTATLTDKLIELSDQLLKSDLPTYVAGKLPARAQPHPDRATYSRKLTKEDGLLDFRKSARQLEREVRAFIEWPKSHAKLADFDVIITKASVTDNGGEPGTVTVKDKRLLINCGEGALVIEKLKPAGKSEMTAGAFLAGYSNRI